MRRCLGLLLCASLSACASGPPRLAACGLGVGLEEHEAGQASLFAYPGDTVTTDGFMGPPTSGRSPGVGQ